MPVFQGLAGATGLFGAQGLDVRRGKAAIACDLDQVCSNVRACQHLQLISMLTARHGFFRRNQADVGKQLADIGGSRFVAENPEADQLRAGSKLRIDLVRAARYLRGLEVASKAAKAEPMRSSMAASCA